LYSNQFDEIIAYPSCISASTYGITQFWAEEYWAWIKVQELRSLYPEIDLTGLINEKFENQLLNIMKTSPHGKLVGTNDYNDILIGSWEICYGILNIATSHAPSRFKAQKYLRKFGNDFRIISFDAHLDLGKSDLIHAAWLTEDLAKKTAIIGGWSETSVDLDDAKSLIPFISTCLNNLYKKKDFMNWIKGKKVYVTVDLDFFPSDKIYMGLSSYWHRNMFIGHAMNIKQRIEIQKDVKFGLSNELAGVQLQLFRDIFSFLNQKKESIQSQVKQINRLVESIVNVFQENSTSILGLDLVEYSPICDWQNLTIHSLKDDFQHISDLIKTVRE
jgi:hypothetical protein